MVLQGVSIHKSMTNGISVDAIIINPIYNIIMMI